MKNPTVKKIAIADFYIGGDAPLVLIAGPCVLEDEKKALQIAQFLLETAEGIGVHFIFKASYDKANRTSASGFRGPGKKEGLRILAVVKKKLGIPVLTDVHCQSDVPAVAAAVDIVQVPAFLCRQTDLLKAVAEKAKCVNVKKGQFLSPYEMKHVVEKIELSGNKNILLTERGTCFGYNNLVVDMCSLPILRSIGYPVVFDVTHSLQLPGGLEKSSGGRAEFVPYLARAGVACGCDAVFLEVHPNPKAAPSDGPNSLALRDVEGLVRELLRIHAIIR